MWICLLAVAIAEKLNVGGVGSIEDPLTEFSRVETKTI